MLIGAVGVFSIYIVTICVSEPITRRYGEMKEENRKVVRRYDKICGGWDRLAK